MYDESLFPLFKASILFISIFLKFLNYFCYELFFASEKSDLRDAFMTAANSMREDFKFAHATAPEVLEEYKYSA